MLSVVLQLFGILALLTFMILSIWSFVILNRAYSQFRYSNYLMEKLQSALLGLNKTIKDSNVDNYLEKKISNDEASFKAELSEEEIEDKKPSQDV